MDYKHRNTNICNQTICSKFPKYVKMCNIWRKNMQQTTDYVCFAYAGKNMHKIAWYAKYTSMKYMCIIYKSMHLNWDHCILLHVLHVLLICIFWFAYILHFHSCIFKHIMHMFAYEMHNCAKFDNGCLCIFDFAHLCILFAYLCK